MTLPQAALLPALLALLAPCLAVAARGSVGVGGGGAAGDAAAARAGSALPAFVNPQVDALQARASQAVLNGLQQKGSATLSRASASAASASSAANKVQYMSAMGELRTVKLKDMVKRANAAGNRAVQFETEARHSNEELQAFTKTATDEAKQLAVKAVQGMFESKYHKLEPWRQKVLTDHYVEAKHAATRATKPYDRKLSTAYARMSEFNAQVAELRSQEEDLRKKAATLRAQAKEDAGTNPAGAKQEFADARHFESVAQGLADEAKVASASAADIEGDINRTEKKRRSAALRAAKEANPESLPPLPVDPETAYAPPPVP